MPSRKTAVVLPATGRPSLFRNKVPDKLRKARLSQEAHDLFEKHRRKVAQISAEILGYPIALADVSDADVIEYLCRGMTGSMAYWSALRDQIAAREK